MLVLLLAVVPAQARIALAIHGVGGKLRANVLAYLSFERYRSSRSLDAETIERLENRVQSEVDTALEPYGYFQPQVHAIVKQTGPKDWRVVLDIAPGPPVILRTVEVRISGPGADDPLFTHITRNMPFHPGERLNEAAYEQLKSELLQTAATYGYIDARLTRHEVRVDPPGTAPASC